MAATSTTSTMTSYEIAAQKDPQAWSLVWDDQIKNKNTWIDNLKTGTPVYYSFDIKDSQSDYAKEGYLKTMTESQKADVKKALQELSNATGVSFQEKSGIKGGLVFAQSDLADAPDDKASTLGEHQDVKLTVMDSTGAVKTVNQNTIMLNYHVTENSNLSPGTAGFETLLHELGHAAGLDDTEGSSSENLANKYPDLDDAKHTIMSYSGDVTNKDYTDLDKRALAILYPKELRSNASASVTGIGGDTASDVIRSQGDYAYYEGQSLTGSGGAAEEDEYEYEYVADGTGGTSSKQEGATSSGGSGGSGDSGGGSEEHEDDSGSTVVAVDKDGPIESKLRLYGTADHSDLSRPRNDVSGSGQASSVVAVEDGSLDSRLLLYGTADHPDLLRPRTDVSGSGLAASFFGNTAVADNPLLKMGGILAKG